ncbi:hypothetical protein [Alkalibacillus salilacus]|uniref:Thioredoxin reductase n=1 Tax=Alkalibacillus salilacus TaxID=284582 RepID=A0ABT9VCZ5_9BACI|nr:hypothetical protein [Alkalibacillus salilacus]MDQ0158842.1 thioredoxin reductase [Alkalibacillus salilacus]
MENRMVLEMERHLSRQPVAECSNCHTEFYQGDEEVVIYDGEHFCDRQCLSEHLLENADFWEVEL